MNQSEINALINLLDDPDKEVFEHVSEKLIAFGSEVIPEFRIGLGKTFDPIMHRRIEDLIHHIQSSSTGQNLKAWIESGSSNLLEGTLIICRYQYPDLKTESILKAIDKLKKAIWLEMNYDLTPLEQVNVFNHVLYSIQNFSGNTLNLTDPQNCYLNHLLESTASIRSVCRSAPAMRPCARMSAASTSAARRGSRTPGGHCAAR